MSRSADHPPGDSSGSSREKILLVAEKLFAKRGIDGVSLRQIAAAAGNGNNNAVQYHFGSREALLQAIFKMRVEQMEAPRRAMLGRAREEGRHEDMETLVQVMMLPHRDLTDDEGRHPHAAVLSEYITRWRPRGVQHPVETDHPGAQVQVHTFNAIRAKLNFLPPRIADARIGLCHLMFLNLLQLSDHEVDRGGGAAELRIHDTIRQIAGHLVAPLADDPVCPASSKER
jgi:AcrR family transcriptional regulator